VKDVFSSFVNLILFYLSSKSTLLIKDGKEMKNETNLTVCCD